MWTTARLVLTGVVAALALTSALLRPLGLGSDPPPAPRAQQVAPQPAATQGTPPASRGAAVASEPTAGVQTQEMVVRAFTPIIDLADAVAYPVCYLMLAFSALLMMTGARSRAIQTAKWAAVGYVLLQLAPAMMSILVQVGSAMRAGAG